MASWRKLDMQTEQRGLQTTLNIQYNHSTQLSIVTIGLACKSEQLCNLKPKIKLSNIIFIFCLQLGLSTTGTTGHVLGLKESTCMSFAKKKCT